MSSYLRSPFITFGGGGAAAAPDIAVTRVALNTSTGNQEVTISGFGTPKAAIFILGSPTAEATEAAHIRNSYGMTDGTNQFAIANAGNDAIGTSITKHIGPT